VTDKPERAPGDKYPAAYRIAVLTEARDTNVAATARKHGISQNTIRKWRRALDEERGGDDVDPLTQCPMCGSSESYDAAAGGFYLREGADVTDIRTIFRIAGVEDLGVKSRGRQSGATMRSESQRKRTGRQSAADRRAGEHG
tara:strand:+ start:984 stop:1409 length:426 start_codon:yes stop_codon:yes gene_type:complete